MTRPARLYGHPSPLREALAEALEIPVGLATVGSHADGERHALVQDGQAGVGAVLLVGAQDPVDSQLMGLAILADAARRSGAHPIVAVVPYLGYARGDRVVELGSPVPCRVVADLLTSVGITHLVVLDLHNPAITGFFKIPVLETSAVPLLARELGALPRDRYVVLAPDTGAVPRAGKLAALLGLPLAGAIKRRLAEGAPKVVELWGDLTGKDVILIDDMVTTGSTIDVVARMAKQRGATALDVVCSHPVMCDRAEERLRALGIRRFVVSDSLLYQPKDPWPGFAIVGIAPLLASEIRHCLAL